MKNSLTVYICTYHEEGNIEDCIKHVRANGCNNIVVVDASDNDLTLEKTIKAGAEVVKATKGLALQRQVAIDHCKTDYLMFVDADDRLDECCINELFDDIKKCRYAAVQACLRVFCPKTYCQKGIDAVWQHCTSVPGPTNMVGRPALYKTMVLKKVGMDTVFGDNANEDATLSIRLEQIGARLGVGKGSCFRLHPPTFRENLIAWKKYGQGDARLIRGYPGKLKNVIKHLIYILPVQRSFTLIKKGKAIYAGYPVAMGLFRFAYMLGDFLRNAQYEKEAFTYAIDTEKRTPRPKQRI